MVIVGGESRQKVLHTLGVAFVCRMTLPPEHNFQFSHVHLELSAKRTSYRLVTKTIFAELTITSISMGVC